MKAALQKEEDDKFLPRKRKRKSKTGEGEEDEKSDDEEKDHKEEKRDEGKSQNKPEKFKIPKKNAQLPPPIDFQSLLKLAEKKQHEPIMIEKKVEEKLDRPMTEKEKLEYRREKERKLRKEMGISESAHRANEMKKKAMKSKSEVAERSLDNTTKLIPGERLKNGAEPSVPSGILKKSLISDNLSQKLKNPPNPKKAKADEVKTEASKEQNSEKPAIGVLSERQKMLLAHKRNSELETKRMAELEIRRREAKLNKLNQSKELPRERLSNAPSHSLLKSTNSDIPVPKLSKAASESPMPSKSVSFAKPMEPKRLTSSNGQGRQFPPSDLVPKRFPPPDVVRKKPPPKPMMRRKYSRSQLFHFV